MTALLVMAVFTIGGQRAEAADDGRWQAAMTDAVFAEDEEIHPLVTLTAEDSLG